MNKHQINNKEIRSNLSPTRMFLEITTECNLTCKLCKLWQTKDPLTKISIDDKIHFLEQLYQWLNQNGQSISNFSIVFSGGEPFLYPEQVFLLSKTCKSLGFPSFINTNGALLKPWLSSIPQSGLSGITISLDSHVADIHDDLRGTSGLFNKVVEDIHELLIQSEKQQSKLRLYIQSILGSWNVDSLEDQIKWIMELGVDGIMFQCIQFPFGIPIPSGWYRDFPYFPDSNAVQSMINIILKMKRNGAPIVNAYEEINWWNHYFKDPEFLPEEIHVCRAFDQNIIVDISGNVKFCFNKMLSPPNRVGNIRTNAIEDLWRGQEALSVKEEMKKCRRSCGAMICHCDSNIRA